MCLKFIQFLHNLQSFRFTTSSCPGFTLSERFCGVLEQAGLPGVVGDAPLLATDVDPRRRGMDLRRERVRVTV